MDWMTELFGESETTQAEVEAGLLIAREKEAARLQNLKVEQEALRLRQITRRCPRCMGSGKLPQFTYRAGGICFRCGGSGMI